MQPPLTWRVLKCALAGALVALNTGELQSQTYTFTTIAGQPGVSGSQDGTNNEARFSSPSELALDPSGAIYVSDFQNHTIRKLTPIGDDWVVTTLAGMPGVPQGIDGTNSEARFNRPSGLKPDRNGNLLVADLYNHTIRQLSPSGSNWAVRTVAGVTGVPGTENGTNSGARFWQPRGLTIRKNGQICIVDNSSHIIRGMTAEGTNWIVTTLAGEHPYYGFADGTNEWAEFNFPFSIASGSDGSLYVTDWGNNAIRRIQWFGQDRVTTTIAGFTGSSGTNDGPALLAMFNSPAGVAVDSSGTLFITDQYNNTIRKMTPKGADWEVATIGGTPLQVGTADGQGSAARFRRPWGIAVDAAGNLFIADYLNHTIRKGTPSIAPSPTLEFALVKNGFLLSWPSSAVEYSLETAPDLSPATLWTQVTNGIVVVELACFFTNDVTASSAFFRLRKR